MTHAQSLRLTRMLKKKEIFFNLQVKLDSLRVKLLDLV